MKNLKILLVLILTISRMSFAQNCIFPEITTVTGSGTYCFGEEVTLTVSGALNSAANWQWYAEKCGGAEIENGTNSFITITIKSDTTFFVRGVGGCVASRASCTEVVLKLEDVNPVVTCPEDIIVENEIGVCFAVVEYELPTGTDNCSEVVVTQVEGFGSGSQFPVGVTNEIFEITDSAGNTTICSISVTVFDTEIPIILCPVDISVFNDPGECGAIVSYETPSGTDNCPGSEIEKTEGLGSGSFFPVGSTTETYTITDASGNTSTCSFIVTVEDNEPPIITINDKHTVLWPPNHIHHTVAIDEYIESVTDNCPGITIDDVIIDKVSSDEMQNEKGDGNTLDDIVISDDCKSVQLLAERQGGGNGRVYTITLAVLDAHGNMGTAVFSSSVPHDRGKKNEAIDDGINYVVNGCDLIDEGESSNSRIANNGRFFYSFSTYPNPFSTSLSINYKPSVSAYLYVELYDLAGNKVAEIYKGQVEVEKDYNWLYEAEGLRENIYLIVIKGEGINQTQRVIYRNN